jgi:guanylate kinase
LKSEVKKVAAQSVVQPRLVIISAPSGAGKTTLCERLIRDVPNFALSISATTRPIRPYEKNGVHYLFVTAEEFERRIRNHEFAEWAEVHQYRYGTLRKTIDDHLKAGQHVLFDIDVQGAMNLKALYGNRVLLIFIHPPSMKELEKRLRERKGDSAASIETRLRNAYNEVGWSAKFDYQITNDDLERAYQELRQILAEECA